MVAPVGDVRHGGGVVAEGAILELVDDRLVLVIEAAKHEEKLDSGAEGCLGFIKKGEVLAEVSLAIERGAGALVESLKEQEHGHGDITFIIITQHK